ncbi:MAG: E3 binding domain-containing protein [Candidatus Didemnitutus sp.]|nr:E3 binding domain-containing protein [Candidatus Didemnitutus sp.]
MPTFQIDVPMPSMGATVSELTIINIVVAPGAKVAKGQKLAELESDKSAFDFESPAEGTIVAVKGNKGEVKRSGDALFRMETSDQSLQHLAIATAQHDAQAATQAAPHAPAAAAKALVWTPRATKMAQEAGLDPTTISDIEATGPGGRVSGDDVAKYLASRK